MYAQMPPELLVSIGVQRYVLKSFYLMPSLIHRLESLMLASQLREDIDCHSSSFQISSSLVCHTCDLSFFGFPIKLYDYFDQFFHY